MSGIGLSGSSTTALASHATDVSGGTLDGAPSAADAVLIERTAGAFAEHVALAPARWNAALLRAFGQKASGLLARPGRAPSPPEPPEVRFAPEGTFAAGATGAYDAAGGTIWLAPSLRERSGALLATYAEELGHHLDALLGGGDARGDEGAIFARTLLGEAPTGAALAALRAEDDRGWISVAGRPLAVEFDDAAEAAPAKLPALETFSDADAADFSLDASTSFAGAGFDASELDLETLSPLVDEAAPTEVPATDDWWLAPSVGLGEGTEFAGFAPLELDGGSDGLDLDALSAGASVFGENPAAGLDPPPGLLAVSRERKDVETATSGAPDAAPFTGFEFTPPDTLTPGTAFTDAAGGHELAGAEHSLMAHTLPVRPDLGYAGYEWPVQAFTSGRYRDTNTQFTLTQRATGKGNMELVVRAEIPQGTPFVDGTPLANGVPTGDAFPEAVIEIDGPVDVEDFGEQGELNARVSAALETVNEKRAAIIADEHLRPKRDLNALEATKFVAEGHRRDLVDFAGRVRDRASSMVHIVDDDAPQEPEGPKASGDASAPPEGDLGDAVGMVGAFFTRGVAGTVSQLERNLKQLRPMPAKAAQNMLLEERWLQKAESSAAETYYAKAEGATFETLGVDPNSVAALYGNLGGLVLNLAMGGVGKKAKEGGNGQGLGKGPGKGPGKGFGKGSPPPSGSGPPGVAKTFEIASGANNLKRFERVGRSVSGDVPLAGRGAKSSGATSSVQPSVGEAGTSGGVGLAVKPSPVSSSPVKPSPVKLEGAPPADVTVSPSPPVSKGVGVTPPPPLPPTASPPPPAAGGLSNGGAGDAVSQSSAIPLAMPLSPGQGASEVDPTDLPLTPGSGEEYGAGQRSRDADTADPYPGLEIGEDGIIPVPPEIPGSPSPYALPQPGQRPEVGDAKELAPLRVDVDPGELSEGVETGVPISPIELPDREGATVESGEPDDVPDPNRGFGEDGIELGEGGSVVPDPNRPPETAPDGSPGETTWTPNPHVPGSGEAVEPLEEPGSDADDTAPGDGEGIGGERLRDVTPEEGAVGEGAWTSPDGGGGKTTTIDVTPAEDGTVEPVRVEPDGLGHADRVGRGGGVPDPIGYRRSGQYGGTGGTGFGRPEDDGTRPWEGAELPSDALAPREPPPDFGVRDKKPPGSYPGFLPSGGYSGSRQNDKPGYGVGGSEVSPDFDGRTIDVPLTPSAGPLGKRAADIPGLPGDTLVPGGTAPPADVPRRYDTTLDNGDRISIDLTDDKVDITVRPSLTSRMAETASMKSYVLRYRDEANRGTIQRSTNRHTDPVFTRPGDSFALDPEGTPLVELFEVPGHIGELSETELSERYLTAENLVYSQTLDRVGGIPSGERAEGEPLSAAEIRAGVRYFNNFPTLGKILEYPERFDADRVARAKAIIEDTEAAIARFPRHEGESFTGIRFGGYMGAFFREGDVFMTEFPVMTSKRRFHGENNFVGGQPARYNRDGRYGTGEVDGDLPPNDVVITYEGSSGADLAELSGRTGGTFAPDPVVIPGGTVFRVASVATMSDGSERKEIRLEEIETDDRNVPVRSLRPPAATERPSPSVLRDRATDLGARLFADPDALDQLADLYERYRANEHNILAREVAYRIDDVDGKLKVIPTAFGYVDEVLGRGDSEGVNENTVATGHIHPIWDLISTFEGATVVFGSSLQDRRVAARFELTGGLPEVIVAPSPDEKEAGDENFQKTGLFIVDGNGDEHEFGPPRPRMTPALRPQEPPLGTSLGVAPYRHETPLANGDRAVVSLEYDGRLKLGYRMNERDPERSAEPRTIVAQVVDDTTGTTRTVSGFQSGTEAEPDRSAASVDIARGSEGTVTFFEVPGEVSDMDEARLRERVSDARENVLAPGSVETDVELLHAEPYDGLAVGGIPSEVEYGPGGLTNVRVIEKANYLIEDRLALNEEIRDLDNLPPRRREQIGATVADTLLALNQLPIEEGEFFAVTTVGNAAGVSPEEDVRLKFPVGGTLTTDGFLVGSRSTDSVPYNAIGERPEEGAPGTDVTFVFDAKARSLADLAAVTFSKDHENFVLAPPGTEFEIVGSRFDRRNSRYVVDLTGGIDGEGRSREPDGNDDPGPASPGGSALRSQTRLDEGTTRRRSEPSAPDSRVSEGRRNGERPVGSTKKRDAVPDGTATDGARPSERGSTGPEGALAGSKRSERLGASALGSPAENTGSAAKPFELNIVGRLNANAVADPTVQSPHARPEDRLYGNRSLQSRALSDLPRSPDTIHDRRTVTNVEFLDADGRIVAQGTPLHEDLTHRPEDDVEARLAVPHDTNHFANAAPVAATFLDGTVGTVSTDAPATDGPIGTSGIVDEMINTGVQSALYTRLAGNFVNAPLTSGDADTDAAILHDLLDNTFVDEHGTIVEDIQYFEETPENRAVVNAVVGMGELVGPSPDYPGRFGFRFDATLSRNVRDAFLEAFEAHPDLFERIYANNRVVYQWYRDVMQDPSERPYDLTTGFTPEESRVHVEAILEGLHRTIEQMERTDVPPPPGLLQTARFYERLSYPQGSGTSRPDTGAPAPVRPADAPPANGTGSAAVTVPDDGFVPRVPEERFVSDRSALDRPYPFETLAEAQAILDGYGVSLGPIEESAFEPDGEFTDPRLNPVPISEAELLESLRVFMPEIIRLGELYPGLLDGLHIVGMERGGTGPTVLAAASVRTPEMAIGRTATFGEIRDENGRRISSQQSIQAVFRHELAHFILHHKVSEETRERLLNNHAEIPLFVLDDRASLGRELGLLEKLKLRARSLLHKAANFGGSTFTEFLREERIIPPDLDTKDIDPELLRLVIENVFNLRIEEIEEGVLGIHLPDGESTLQIGEKVSAYAGMHNRAVPPINRIGPDNRIGPHGGENVYETLAQYPATREVIFNDDAPNRYGSLLYRSVSREESLAEIVGSYLFDKGAALRNEDGDRVSGTGVIGERSDRYREEGHGAVERYALPESMKRNVEGALQEAMTTVPEPLNNRRDVMPTFDMAPMREGGPSEEPSSLGEAGSGPDPARADEGFSPRVPGTTAAIGARGDGHRLPESIRENAESAPREAQDALAEPNSDAAPDGVEDVSEDVLRSVHGGRSNGEVPFRRVAPGNATGFAKRLLDDPDVLHQLAELYASSVGRGHGPFDREILFRIDDVDGELRVVVLAEGSVDHVSASDEALRLTVNTVATGHTHPSWRVVGEKHLRVPYGPSSVDMALFGRDPARLGGRHVVIATDHARTEPDGASQRTGLFVIGGNGEVELLEGALRPALAPVIEPQAPLPGTVLGTAPHRHEATLPDGARAIVAVAPDGEVSVGYRPAPADLERSVNGEWSIVATVADGEGVGDPDVLLRNFHASTDAALDARAASFDVAPDGGGDVLFHVIRQDISGLSDEAVRDLLRSEDGDAELVHRQGFDLEETGGIPDLPEYGPGALANERVIGAVNRVLGHHREYGDVLRDPEAATPAGREKTAALVEDTRLALNQLPRAEGTFFARTRMKGSPEDDPRFRVGATFGLDGFVVGSSGFSDVPYNAIGEQPGEWDESSDVTVVFVPPFSAARSPADLAAVQRDERYADAVIVPPGTEFEVVLIEDRGGREFELYLRESARGPDRPAAGTTDLASGTGDVPVFGPVFGPGFGPGFGDGERTAPRWESGTNGGEEPPPTGDGRPSASGGASTSGGAHRLETKFELLKRDPSLIRFDADAMEQLGELYRKNRGPYGNGMFAREVGFRIDYVDDRVEVVPLATGGTDHVSFGHAEIAATDRTIAIGHLHPGSTVAGLIGHIEYGFSPLDRRNIASDPTLPPHFVVAENHAADESPGFRQSGLFYTDDGLDIRAFEGALPPGLAPVPPTVPAANAPPTEVVAYADDAVLPDGARVAFELDPDGVVRVGYQPPPGGAGPAGGGGESVVAVVMPFGGGMELIRYPDAEPGAGTSWGDGSVEVAPGSGGHVGLFRLVGDVSAMSDDEVLEQARDVSGRVEGRGALFYMTKFGTDEVGGISPDAEFAPGAYGSVPLIRSLNRLMDMSDYYNRVMENAGSFPAGERRRVAALIDDAEFALNQLPVHEEPFYVLTRLRDVGEFFDTFDRGREIAPAGIVVGSSNPAASRAYPIGRPPGAGRPGVRVELVFPGSGEARELGAVRKVTGDVGDGDAVLLPPGSRFEVDDYEFLAGGAVRVRLRHADETGARASGGAGGEGGADPLDDSPLDRSLLHPPPSGDSSKGIVPYALGERLTNGAVANIVVTAEGDFAIGYRPTPEELDGIERGERSVVAFVFSDGGESVMVRDFDFGGGSGFKGLTDSFDLRPGNTLNVSFYTFSEDVSGRSQLDVLKMMSNREYENRYMDYFTLE